MNETYRVPWPVIRLPFGHMAEHPLRLQLSWQIRERYLEFQDGVKPTLSRERFYRI